MAYSGQTYSIAVTKGGYTVFRDNFNVGTTNHVVPTIELEAVPDYIEFLIGNHKLPAEHIIILKLLLQSKSRTNIYMADEN